MRRIDIPVSKIGTHFQTFSDADECLGGGGGCGVSLWLYTIFKCLLFEKKTSHTLHPAIDPLRS